jgi:hypothetical protein
MNDLKKNIQAWIDSRYERWVSLYSPQKHEGAEVLRLIDNAKDENIWTVSDEFVQDFFTAAGGQEIPFASLCIIPGIQDGSDEDILFLSSLSWVDQGDEYEEVPIEVVFTCQTCLRSGASCQDCQGSGEWAFVAGGWFE